MRHTCGHKASLAVPKTPPIPPRPAFTLPWAKRQRQTYAYPRDGNDAGGSQDVVADKSQPAVADKDAVEGGNTDTDDDMKQCLAVPVPDFEEELGDDDEEGETGVTMVEADVPHAPADEEQVEPDAGEVIDPAVDELDGAWEHSGHDKWQAQTMQTDLTAPWHKYQSWEGEASNNWKRGKHKYGASSSQWHSSAAEDTAPRRGGWFNRCQRLCEAVLKNTGTQHKLASEFYAGPEQL